MLYINKVITSWAILENRLCSFLVHTSLKELETVIIEEWSCTPSDQLKHLLDPRPNVTAAHGGPAVHFIDSDNTVLFGSGNSLSMSKGFFWSCILLVNGYYHRKLSSFKHLIHIRWKLLLITPDLSWS